MMVIAVHTGDGAIARDFVYRLHHYSADPVAC